jgi:membrane protease YdiL (CAAX protease family)
MTEHHVSGRRLLIAIAAWLTLAAGLGTATFFVQHSIGPPWSGVNSLGAVISADVYGLLIASLFAAYGREQVRNALGLRIGSRWRRDQALSFGFWIAWIGALAAIMIAVSPVFGSPVAQLRHILHLVTDAPHLSGTSPFLICVMIVRAAVLAPLAEELLFRGAIFGWLRQRHTFIAAALVSSAIFAAIHIYPELYLFAFLYGFGAAWVRERTGQLTSLLAVHAISNMLLFLLALAVHV